jgi:hypothetical protein
MSDDVEWQAKQLEALREHATVCVRLDGLADKIAAVVHEATCDFGNPCPAGPGDKDDARASAVIALLLSLAVQ